MDRSNKEFKILYKCITANTCAIWQDAVHTTDQLTYPSAKQEQYKKAEEKIERTTGLGR